MSDTSAGRAADTILPPTLTGTLPSGINTVPTKATTSSTAGRSALTLPSNNGKVYVTVAAVTTDVYIAFKLGTAAASVTTTTGWPVFAGTKESYWINPAEVNDIEYITASAAGAIHFVASSTKYEGQ